MAVVKGTRKAFEALIAERGIYSRLGVDRSTVSNWKRGIAAGTYPTLDKMEEMLQKVGAKVVTEKIWEI